MKAKFESDKGWFSIYYTGLDIIIKTSESLIKSGFLNYSLTSYNEYKVPYEQMKNSLSVSSDIFRGGSTAAATSKMERFVIIVNGFQPLTIIAKPSILDVVAALDPPLIILEESFGFQLNVSFGVLLPVFEHCVKIVQIRNFFWSAFELNTLVRMRENMNQKKLRTWTLFTQ